MKWKPIEWGKKLGQKPTRITTVLGLMILFVLGIGALPFSDVTTDTLLSKRLTKVDVKTCQQDPRLVEIDIGKDNISNNDSDRFRFFAKLINPNVDPSELLYRWMIKPPEGSKVSTAPQTTYRMNLEPDVWGTYHIILSLGDKEGNCHHAIYVFNYPDIEDPRVSGSPFVLQASLFR